LWLSYRNPSEGKMLSFPEQVLSFAHAVHHPDLIFINQAICW